MTPPTTSSAELRQRLADAFRSWDPIAGPPRWSPSTFEGWTREVFAHQYTHVPAYRTLCDRRGITPADDPRASEIPAVPTDAFKVARLFAGSDDEILRTFKTSGTTAGRRGAHHFRSLELYRASLHPTFRRFCTPDGQALRMLVLAPSPSALPESSLSFMLGELVEALGAPQSRFFIDLDDRGQWQIRFDELCHALDDAQSQSAPTMLLGTAFAFAEFFDRTDRTWRLPEGSRLMETGGFKGAATELSRDELYRAFTTRLGLTPSHCLGEYSMTELSSQTYTDGLRAEKHLTGRFFGPPWLAIQIVDPLSLNPYEETGQAGLIRFVDLANLDSVSAVQTSDRGILHDDGGLEFLGRAPGAQLRGCSLTIEEIVDGLLD